jgi:hypothetical protein
MSSILVDTLNYRWRKKNGLYYFGADWSFNVSSFDKIERKFYLSQFLNSLLLFDKIYIQIQHLEEFIALFGIGNTHKLFLSESIIVIDDGGTTTGFLPNGEMNLLMNFDSTSALKFDKIQERLLELYKGHFECQFVKPLILKAENLKIEINGGELGNISEQEIFSDFKNQNIMDFLKFQNPYDNTIVKDEDIFPLMRLNYANRSLIYQNSLNIENLSTEASIQPLINMKIGASLNPNHTEPIELFRDIITQKQIPDLTELFLNNIISIDDILSFRSNVSGKKFREWLDDANYNKSEVYKQIMSSKKDITDKMMTKLVRWIYPKLIGMANPSLGLIVSAVDSFILGKMLKGWHPNFFLDDVLSKKLNEMLKENQETIKRKKIQSNFGRDISRNDKCPCGSMKKYKNCCGR